MRPHRRRMPLRVATHARTGWLVPIALSLGLVPAAVEAAHMPAPPPDPGPATGPASGNAAAPAAPTRTAPVGQAVLGRREIAIGSRGGDVRTLQRILRRRGFRLIPDGVFGSHTRAAVRALQRRWRTAPTGRADFAFLRRLGVRLRAVAGGTAPAPAPAPVAAPYPVAGPDAAKARYLKTLPVQGKHRYFNDWGAPRSQGRHEGTDVMAARGVPVVSVGDGVISRLTRTETGLGGIWIWLRDRAGNTYYYAHLNAIVPGLAAGTRVKVGQPLGSVGNSGDARYGATHLHFEIHPGGGSATNPYPELLLVDPEPPRR